MSGFWVPGHLHRGAAWCWGSVPTGTAHFWLLLSHSTVVISGLRSNCDEPHKFHGSLPVTLLSWWQNPSVLEKTSISVCIFLMQKHAGQLSCINHCVSLGAKAKGFCTRTAGQIHLSLISEDGQCSTLWTSSAQAGCCRETPSSMAVSWGPGKTSGYCSGYFLLQADFVLYPLGFVAGLLRSCPRDVPKHHRLRCQRTASCSTHLASSFGGSLGGHGCSALSENSFLQESEDSSSPKLMLTSENNKQPGRSEIQPL